METTQALGQIPFEELGQQLKLSPVQIQNAVSLLDEGWSIPFLAQFRLDHTDGAGERVLIRLSQELANARQQQQRKSNLVEYLKSRDELTPAIEEEITRSTSREQVEHLHAIYKRNRQPKAMIDRNQAAGPLATQVLDGSITEEALASAAEALANELELFADANDVRAAVAEYITIRFAAAMSVRELALNIVRDTGSFNCRRYQAGDDGSSSEPVSPEAKDKLDSASGERAAANAESTEDKPPQVSQADSTSNGAAESPASPPVDEASTDSETKVEPAVDASPAAPSDPTADNTTSAASQPPKKHAKANLSLPEQRRQKRKESRLRRRAHLESMLKSYFGKTISLEKLTATQFGDIDYGERVRVLTAELQFNRDRLDKEGAALVVPKHDAHRELIQGAWQAALDKYVIPDCERIVRRYFGYLVEQQSIGAISRRVRGICMQRPIYRTLMAVTGNRDGFGLAVIDEAGQPIHSENMLRNDFGPEKIKERVVELAEKHSVHALAIADAPRTRLIEQLAAESLGEKLKEKGTGWFVTCADGLDNYCKSAVCCEEIPNVTPEQRSAIALGRRAQNPLHEFVKCAPRDWLTEKQQTTVDVNRASDEIRNVYQSCLARAGVDINRVSAAVLKQLPGLDESTARRIEAQRIKLGKFDNLGQCDDLNALPDLAKTQLSGFLRVIGGDSPLEALGIHPEAHEAATKVLKRCDFSTEQLAERVKAEQTRTVERTEAGAEWNRKLRNANIAELSGQVGIGREQLKRIVNELRFAGRDVRLNSKLPVVRQGGLSMADIKPGEMFAGRVVNVANFGAFVEVSQNITGLLHISRLGDHFVRDPRDLVAIGEYLPVWIVSIDREKQRIALSLSPANASSSDRPRTKSARPPRRRPDGKSGRPDNRRGRRNEYASKPRKSKPVVPITDEMKSGDAPMRTFGDLKQFFDLSKSDDKKSDSDSGKSSSDSSSD